MRKIKFLLFILAFVLNWQLGYSLNKIVKPSLQKVELS